MRAVIVREFGPPEVLEAGQAEDPSAGEGEVVVDVELANVTFVETQVRAGKPPHPAMLPALPAILGNGVGGVVAEVGAGVDANVMGRRVITSLNGSGGYAERTAAAAQRLVEAPTAWRCATPSRCWPTGAQHSHCSAWRDHATARPC